MNYDIIGDIHGQADKLDALLYILGYRKTAGACRHSERQAIFVGDFVDRGPAQMRSVDTVRRMVEAGAALAVMGNHELNAIAWHTPDPERPGAYLRSHLSAKWGDTNRKQHAAFLAEVEDKPALHAETIDWFLTLPLWLDLPGVRVVHACWHAPFMGWLSPQLHQGRYLTRDLMVPATDEPEDDADKDSATPSVFKAVEAVTKGIEVPLPAGHHFHDKDGNCRNRVRVRWWDEGATTYRSAAMLSPAERAELPDLPIPEYARVEKVAKPTFFGHYWLTGEPSLQSDRAVCVDYSAGKGGALVAYRFDGEPDLVADRFVWVA
jgi:diadenosine tetraphosphatase ApaH/serine/threonine PP2A family protein phosphatase